MKYYKLLSQDLKSYNNTQWELNKTITVNIPGNAMCSNQVLHCYNHPLLAVFLNPIHAAISDPRLFEIEVDEIVANDGLKFASKSQTLIKELELPKISLEQKIEFGIRVAKLVYNDENWNIWADHWLNGKDRSRESAIVACASCSIASYAACAACAACAAASYAARNDLTTSNVTAWVLLYTNASIISNNNDFNQKIIDIIEENIKVKE
ncbi:MAG TPA: hypothetical protein PK075_12140 [Chitinophagales bacterium]|nr:hypothetical protein [Chitinophagales bacterium]